jgi:hypothetical protein
MKHTFLASWVLLLCVSPAVPPARAQDSGRAGPAAVGLPDEAGEFDFWIGTWTAPGGTDKVKRFGSGVAVLETWTGGGGKGWSVNVFDASAKTWTQTWYHSAGTFFQLTGKMEGGRMVLVGSISPPGGPAKLLRLSFIEITASSFSQLYEESSDGGATWVVTNRIPFRRVK